MPRGFNNWNAPQVIRFLKQNGFIHGHTRGSHFYYIKKGDEGNPDRQVTVPVHAAVSLHPKIIKSIIRQSGIPEKIWLDF